MIRVFFGLKEIKIKSTSIPPLQTQTYTIAKCKQLETEVSNYHPRLLTYSCILGEFGGKEPFGGIE
jgi:hypothetical protein